MKWVKDATHTWKNDHVKKLGGQLAQPKVKILDLEKVAEKRTLSEEERISWKECKVNLIELERLEKLDLQQKAKVK